MWRWGVGWKPGVLILSKPNQMLAIRVNVRWNLAAHAHEEIVFHTMRRHAEAQSLGSHWLG